MFNKRAGGTPRKQVQGRPSLGVNVVGRAMVGGFDTVVGGFDMITPNVVKRATKIIITNPLARVARTTAQLGKSGVEGAMGMHATFGLRKKIFPRKQPHTQDGGGDATKNLMQASKQWTEKQEDVVEYILKELRKNFLFAELETSQLNTLVQAFEKITCSKGEAIIHQGEEGDYFYILYHGGVVYEIDGEAVGSIVANSDLDPDLVDDDTSPKSFGELALFFAAPRAASVIAETECVLYRLDQVNFRLVAQHQGMQEDHQRVALLKTIPVLQELDELSLNKLVSAMSVLQYHKDEVLFQKGDHMTDFFIVQTGLVQATDVSWGGAQYEDSIIGPGKTENCFGWLAMTQDEPLRANVSAVTDSTLLAIQGDTFRRVVGRHDEILRNMELVRQLQSIAIFRDSQLHEEELLGLVDLLQTESYTRKTTLIREGSVIDASLTFVRKGSVTVESKEEMYSKTMEVGAYFGQESMLTDQNKDVAEDQPPLVKVKYTVVAAPGTELDVLTLEDVRKVVNTALLGLGKPSQISGLDKSIQIEDIKRHKMLGAGRYVILLLLYR
jgi:cAMP-dependent protein kinase regulator